jgi:hypothetical protein
MVHGEGTAQSSIGVDATPRIDRALVDTAASSYLASIWVEAPPRFTGPATLFLGFHECALDGFVQCRALRTHWC